MGERARAVFVTGATGFLGRALIPRLLERGHAVQGLTRPGSEGRLPRGCQPVLGDVFSAPSFRASLALGSTLVHLVGVAAPAPWKQHQFRTVDGASVTSALEAARAAGVRHFVYVSVAQPAPVMRAYLRVRAECEAEIRRARLPATFLRPWYVVGPGRRWPLALRPLYWLAERLPATAAGAQRLGLITLTEMIAALLWAIENPPEEPEPVRVLDVPELRRVAARLRSGT